jgi:glycosyltransferase involved in cell wall biosynthesis
MRTFVAGTPGTADTVWALARRHPNVRCLQRIGRRCPASACVEGVLSSAAPFIAVMDGDLQHDEGLLPEMAALRGEGLDIVIGSRCAAGGGSASMPKLKLIYGLLSFYVRCSVGAVANVGIAALCLPRRPFMVAGRCHRRARRCRVELRDLVDIHLADAII